MKKLFLPLLLSLAVLLFGGCANHIEESTAGLRADIVKVQRAANGDIQVTWRVHNPNVVGYVLTRHLIKLSLDGVEVGTLSGERRFAIPSMNQAENTHVLTVTDPAATQAIAAALARGSAGYAFDATLWLLIIDDDIEKFTLVGSGTVPTATE